MKSFFSVKKAVCAAPTLTVAQVLETPPQLSPRDFAAATLAEVIKTGSRMSIYDKVYTGGVSGKHVVSCSGLDWEGDRACPRITNDMHGDVDSR